MTYAAGVKAKTVVRVAEEIREEHREVLRWLNDSSSSDVRFYGVQLKLFRIGNSAPAPSFNILVRPNELIRARREAPSETKDQSERNLFYIEYWTAFKAFCTNEGSSFQLQTPRPQYFTQAALGRAGIHLAFVAARRDQWIGCEITLRDTAVIDVLPQLESSRSAIEAELSFDLHWDRSSDKFAKISLQKSAVPRERADWTLQHRWLFEKGQSMLSVFKSRISRS